MLVLVAVIEAKDEFKMGKRGEGWVISQLVLLAIILSAPRIGGSVELPLWLRVLGGLIVIAAGAVVIMGALALGRNLTPFPKPASGGHLITHGIYGIVRHPLYMAGIFATLGWGLLAANLIDIALVAVVFLFFDLKSRREEEWLLEAYPEYASYRRHVKKLIPWIY
jgi:protein-S-isoprenylcysteine O-methyltransferase Ste14